mmetsp:Transcript_5038/g.9876  ORF Transcript_5038/g.9876 Transcript_5038/m.9876 type:complete len:387 (+) Transcript_5038:91-1251(+)|eukprot:CAMPEP_0173393266 /NCGR_PEP_ID=MMETSP1356-20130122/22011_1 /TAXON_ID=77927 ORGANISM="Hemiselmis virescens, Strain PCC157" /NCGR_SAMPLE_ID=MMETSP1356 /ASSEMBLY_ACC=CAM_ASM_000847 /LENGTH=386 /DNA_ID=CAMNT_0014351265 /DNA_START=87 /DNA_END=1247 /DNA_ORIENTATION=+
MTTPPFPANGPDAQPEFDGHTLVLLKHATPPAVLEAHIARLGLEIDGEKLSDNGKVGGFEWPPPAGSELEKILQGGELVKWDYDLFKLNELSGGRPLAAIAQGIIRSHGLVEKLKLDEATLARYLNALETTYNACVYHNPMHAADVMHGTNFLLSGDLAAKLPPEELLVGLICGPAHDLGHPGVNNGFLIKRGHPVAETYNKLSVLENHHVGLSLRIMDLPGMDVLSCFDAAKRAELRDMMQKVVLFTDMTKHAELMVLMKAVTDEGRALECSRPDDRLLILQTVLHTADIGNPCKPWHIHIQWTHAIVAEFFSQGDLERGLGLELSPGCDRLQNCGRTSQKNFIQFFVRPLFVLCAEVIKETAEKCTSCYLQLDKNVERWIELGF